MFVDESGGFDSSLEPSRFYIVTLFCHDQAEDIKPLADELESQLGYLGYPDTCIHAGPLLRREEDFRAVEIETRRKLFGRMLAFTRKLPVYYLSLVVDKQDHTTPEDISKELKRQFGDFIGRPEGPLARARKIKLYYDDETAGMRGGSVTLSLVLYHSCLTPRKPLTMDGRDRRSRR